MASLSWRTHHIPDLISLVFGEIIGALFISYATWPWVFYTSAIVALLIAITCTFLIPSLHHPQNKHSQSKQFRRLDVSGCSLLVGKCCTSLASCSYIKVQSCSGALYLRGDVGFDEGVEDNHCLDSAFLVCASFRLVLCLGSTNSRGSCFTVCNSLALPFNTCNPV